MTLTGSFLGKRNIERDAKDIAVILKASSMGGGTVTTELTSTLLLAPIGTATLATEFWANSDAIAYGAAAPYAALMVLISAPMAYLLTRTAGRTR